MWYPVPATVKQAKTLPNWPRFRIAMDAFMGRTIDGLLPVAPSITRGSPISRVKWVFDYKVDENGDPLEKARQYGRTMKVAAQEELNSGR